MSNIVIGKVVGVFGLKGQVKLRSYLENQKVLADIDHVYVKLADDIITLKVNAMHPHKDVWLMKLEGYTTPESAMTLKGCLFEVEKSVLPSLKPDEIYWFEIEGFKVYDTEGRYVGLLNSFMETGSHDVFEIVDGAKHYLISNNKEHVTNIDLETKSVIINRIGLVES